MYHSVRNGLFFVLGYEILLSWKLLRALAQLILQIMERTIA